MADRRRRCQRRRGRFRRMPSKTVIWDRLNPLEVYTDDELFEKFRFRRAIIVLTPRQAVSYVVACVTLHNLGIQTGDIVDKAEQSVDTFHPTAHQVGAMLR